MVPAVVVCTDTAELARILIAAESAVMVSGESVAAAALTAQANPTRVMASMIEAGPNSAKTAGPSTVPLMQWRMVRRLGVYTAAELSLVLMTTESAIHAAQVIRKVTTVGLRGNSRTRAPTDVVVECCASARQSTLMQATLMNPAMMNAVVQSSAKILAVMKLATLVNLTTLMNLPPVVNLAAKRLAAEIPLMPAALVKLLGRVMLNLRSKVLATTGEMLCTTPNVTATDVTTSDVTTSVVSSTNVPATE